MENRLRAARKSRGLTQRELADRADTTLQQISRLERGDRRLTIDWVQRLAQALGCPESEIVGALGLSIAEPVTVRGAIDADRYLRSAFWSADRWYPANVPEDPRYLGLPRFGLEVRGTSLNRRYQSGAILICIALEHLDRMPEPGQRVICHRQNEAGEIEVTAREVRRAPVTDEAQKSSQKSAKRSKRRKTGDSAEEWLWFDSTDPAHQQPIRRAEAKVVALVTGAYTPE